MRYIRLVMIFVALSFAAMRCNGDDDGSVNEAAAAAIADYYFTLSDAAADAGNREILLTALASLGDSAAKPFVRVAADTSPVRRRQAAKGLAALAVSNQLAADAVAKLLADPDLLVQVDATNACKVYKVARPPVVTAIARNLDSKDQRLVAASFQALT